MSTTTHIETVRQKQLSAKDSIIALLKWNELGYCEFQQRMGYVYLQEEFEPDAQVKELPYTREFWGWWKNHWTRRDELFIPHANGLLSATNGIQMLKVIRGLYVDMHDPRRIGFQPHKTLLENTYASMIQRIIDKVTT